MKKTKIFYWIFTALLAAFMTMSAIPDVISTQQAIDIISTHLGYPGYIIPFLGIAKLLGVIAILIPGFPRLKEWAYAGFVFDLTGAAYSSISVGDPFSGWVFVLLPLTVLACSYIFYHKLKNAGKLKTDENVNLSSYKIA
jgi:hypothetical protein